MESETAIAFEVFGKVQGVFFRKYTQAKGEQLGLRGWVHTPKQRTRHLHADLCGAASQYVGQVMNTERGTVVGEALGDKDALERLSQWLRREGSPKSRIDRANIAAVQLDAAGDFPKAFIVRR